MAYPPYYSQQPQSRFPVMDGVDPLAAEAPKMPIPIPGSPAPSSTMAAASPLATHKRGGILGALESVFMPDPGSRWAGALRDGMFNAKESQQNYVEGEAKKALDLTTANYKLQQLKTKGEYQIVGNNVFHVKPDGSTEMISAPQSKGQLMSLYEKWHDAPPGPDKELLHRMLLDANSDEVLNNREAVATTRAGATTQSARIRAATAGRARASIPALPPGFKVIK